MKKLDGGYKIIPRTFKLKKRFYFPTGGYVDKGTIVEYTEEFGGCYWWDLNHFGKDFVENNEDFFEEI